MYYLKGYLSALFLFVVSFTYSQEVNNTASFRNIDSQEYFRLHYENDFFTSSDYYYSQGINLEFTHPSLKKITPEKIYFRFKSSQMKYGLSVEHDAYTPTSIRHEEIILDDRPFAATLTIRNFIVSTDAINAQRISSGIVIGVLGPSAGGKQMQQSIHQWLNNIEPLGWQHQIQNDVVINYQVSYEKKIISYRNAFLLSAYAKANAGTLKDNAGAGTSIMLGRFHSPFSGTENSKDGKNNFQIYFYANPVVSVIGYDAALQGGLLNTDSPYTISSDKISRISFQNDWGIVISIHQLYLEYFQSHLTKEFITGKNHQWGGVRIGVGL